MLERVLESDDLKKVAKKFANGFPYIVGPDSFTGKDFSVQFSSIDKRVLRLFSLPAKVENHIEDVLYILENEPFIGLMFNGDDVFIGELVLIKRR